jgi:hypothetical protein
VVACGVCAGDVAAWGAVGASKVCCVAEDSGDDRKANQPNAESIAVIKISQMIKAVHDQCPGMRRQVSDVTAAVTGAKAWAEQFR